jgi:branched-chain amino acid transport system permease protein
MKKYIDFLTKNPYGQFILFGIILCLIPILQSVGLMKTSTMTIIGNVLIYGIVALGFNLLLGYSGLVSLGTAGFMGIGAYTTGYFMGALNAPFILGLLAAMVVSTIIGVIIGSISLRVEGIYLAILTLCISEILRRAFEEFIPITGGYSGQKIRSFELFGINVDKGVAFWLIAVVMVLVLVLYYNLTRGRVGRALLTMQGSESAAKAMGINIFFYKVIRNTRWGIVYVIR